jgi:phosphoribosylpyrophosphate synthetase
MTKLIARKVGARVGEVVLGRFANRETQVELKECVRGQDIYVVQVPSL